MNFANPFQIIQDWVTQQWIIFFGKKIDTQLDDWIISPIGNIGYTSINFIENLAKKESLIIKNNYNNGLISSIKEFNLTDEELNIISKKIINFYERTSQFEIRFSISWNILFKFLGNIIKVLFSKRLQQLNIPTKNINKKNLLKSEIITLVEPKSNEIKYAFWYRTLESSGEVLFSGLYTTCKLPSGLTCVKAVFPLPNGNATVIFSTKVGENGELILNSYGNKFGEPGFYFLLKDTKGVYWSKYIKSFEDKLIVKVNNENINAEQNLKFWNKKVFSILYYIKQK